MTILHLVRHAPVASQFGDLCFGQHVDPPIEQGRAFSCIDTLRALEPTRVVSSPARRARETASLIAAPFTVDSRWAERDFGIWEGRRWADCWAEVPEAVLSSVERYLAFTPDGAESHREVLARVADAMRDIDATTVVVTHAGTIRAALVCAGVSPEATYSTALPHLSVTTFTRAPNRTCWDTL